MPQDSNRRKQEILMRVAQSRLGVVDSCTVVRRSVDGCINALPVPARFLRIGAVAAAGATGAGLLVRLLPRPRRAVKQAPPPAWLHFLVSELLAGLALPLCRSYFFGSRAASPVQPPPSPASGLLSRLLLRR